MKKRKKKAERKKKKEKKKKKKKKVELTLLANSSPSADILITFNQFNLHEFEDLRRLYAMGFRRSAK